MSLTSIATQEWSDSDHVTIWNRNEKRKIAGNAAPLGRNLVKYLEKHPDCEVYLGQDDLDGTGRSRKRRRNTSQAAIRAKATQVECSVHVPIWHLKERRKIAGNAAPLAKNLASYLARHPETEVYDGQDVRFNAKVLKVSSSGTESSCTSIREEDCFLASIPFDPWLAGSFSQEENISDAVYWERAEENIDKWYSSATEEFQESDSDSCYSSLDPIAEPGFDAPIY